MAVTFNDLIDDCEGYLYSFGIERDKVTSLNQDITNTDTAFAVVDAQQIDRGYIEIDMELMAVLQSDPNSNTVNLHPWGRAERGTVAVAHTSGTRITNTPRFPRSQIAREINLVTSNLYPQLYQVKTDLTQRYIPSIRTYQVPADVQNVMSITYEDIGPSKEWVVVHGWREDLDANPSSFSTGKSVTFYTPIYPGRTLKIVYRAAFGQFVNLTDTMTSVGLQDKWRDIINYMASARIMMGLEAQRLLTDTVEAANRQNTNTGTQPAQATSISRMWMQIAQQRIAEERQLLFKQHPGGIVRVT